MSVIKPGKLISSVVPAGRPTLKGRGAPQRPEREIWDDYTATSKRGRKKREFEKGAGNRMIPRVADQKGDKDQDRVRAENFEEQEGERYQPRTDFAALEEKLGYVFPDRELLERALTHRSAVGLRERADYERLEFLGDAVLDLSVADLLSERHPEAREGELSKMRAALVNTQALAEIARKLELGPYVKLGRGELSSGGAERPSILADVMEAVVGAIYRTGTYEQALATVEHIFGDALDVVTPYDPKTELQEALHAAGSEPPSYLLELVEGPEHAPTFVTVVIVDGEVAGRGRGSTKKGAQQDAAAEALGKMAASTSVELPEGQTVFVEQAMLSSIALVQIGQQDLSAVT